MSERTPKPNIVRAGWVKGHPFPLTTPIDEKRAEFDRMLDKVEREAKAKVLREVAESFNERLPDGTGNGRAYNAHTVSRMLRERADTLIEGENND